MMTEDLPTDSTECDCAVQGGEKVDERKQPERDALTRTKVDDGKVVKATETVGCPESIRSVLLAVGQPGHVETFRVPVGGLVRQSAVFEDLIVKWLDDTEPLPLANVTPRGFRLFIRYLTSGEVSVSNILELEEVWTVAREYKLEVLSRLCRSMWKTFVRPPTVCRVFAVAKAWNEEPLMWQCVDVFDTETLEVINSTGFRSAPADAVKAIVESPQLSLESECQLMTAVLQWGRDECGRLGLKATPSNLRNVIGPFLPHIRFLDMTPEQFVSVVVAERILTEAEERAVLINMAGRMESSAPIPESLSSVRKCRLLKRLSYLTLANPKPNPRSLSDCPHAPPSPAKLVRQVSASSESAATPESSRPIPEGSVFQLVVEVVRGMVQVEEMSLCLFDDSVRDPVSVSVTSVVDNPRTNSRQSSSYTTNVGSDVRRFDCFALQAKAGEVISLTVQTLEDCRSDKDLEVVDLPHQVTFNDTELLVRRNHGPPGLYIHRMYFSYK